jgi:Ca-activated chloride channel family protein
VVALVSYRRGWVYLLPLGLLLPAPSGYAFEWKDLWLRKDQQAARALDAGEAERAAGLFRDPAWRGTAAFEAKDYAGALAAFREGEDSADSWYNRGNALAAQGNYDGAIAAYEKSLELLPDQDDARRNIELLRQARDEQEQQQSQQGQQGDSQEQKQDDQGQPEQQQGGEDESQQQQSRDQSQNSSSSSGGSDDQQDGQESRQEGEQSEEQRDRDDDGENSEDAQGQQQPMPQPKIDTSAMQEDIEKDQAMQQWLRRVPDDPSGLLREKFRYESRLRQQRGESRESKKIW